MGPLPIFSSELYVCFTLNYVISVIIWIFLLLIWILTPYWIPYLQILSFTPFLFCWCCKLRYAKTFDFRLFIHFWLRWVFIAALGLSLVADSGGYSSVLRVSCCSSFSCCGAQALGTWASVIVACRLSCPKACGIFPELGLNPCPLDWQADS